MLLKKILQRRKILIARGGFYMDTTFIVRELPADEQLMQAERKIGKRYLGYYVLCTNEVRHEVNGKTEYFAIPRIISRSKEALSKSDLLKKYDNRDLYFPYSFFLYE